MGVPCLVKEVFELDEMVSKEKFEKQTTFG